MAIPGRDGRDPSSSDFRRREDALARQVDAAREAQNAQNFFTFTNLYRAGNTTFTNLYRNPYDRPLRDT